jgi:alkylated DNA repair dioxygenase AlkB
MSASNSDTLNLPNGFRYIENCIAFEKAWVLYQQLQHELVWQQPSIKVFGKEHRIPRLQVYMGDANAAYRYSGKLFVPVAWHPTVLALKTRLERLFDTEFNAVLINFYRSGADHMGWHSDDEVELGASPTIASVSLGAVRTFKIRHKLSKETLAIPLAHASCLLMEQSSQLRYQHALPKQAKVQHGRINLTFRKIYSI